MILPGRVGRDFSANELASRLNVSAPLDEVGAQPSAAGAHATTVLCLAVLVWECAGVDVRHLTLNDLAVGTALMVVLLALAVGAQWQHRLVMRDYWQRRQRAADRQREERIVSLAALPAVAAEHALPLAVGANSSGALPHPIALRRYLSMVPEDATDRVVPITALRAHIHRVH